MCSKFRMRGDVLMRGFWTRYRGTTRGTMMVLIDGWETGSQDLMPLILVTPPCTSPRLLVYQRNWYPLLPFLSQSIYTVSFDLLLTQLTQMLAKSELFLLLFGSYNMYQVRIQDLCKGGGGHKRDFADIAQWSRGSGKNLGLKIEGQGGLHRSTPDVQKQGWFVTWRLEPVDGIDPKVVLPQNLLLKKWKMFLTLPALEYFKET